MPAPHPLERPLWVLGVVVNAGAVVLAVAGLAGLDRLPESWSSGPWDELAATLLVTVLLWPAWAAARARMDEARALASSLPLAPDSAIRDVVDDVANGLGLRRPPAVRLLVAGPTDRQPLIVAWGDGPLMIDRQLVDSLWPARPQILAFVVAYGMAGIRLGHTRRADAVLLGLAARTPVLGGWLARTRVASRDRLAAGLAPEGAAALTVLATGNTRWHETPLTELRAAAGATDRTGWVRLAALFGAPEPLLGRVAALDRLGLLSGGAVSRSIPEAAHAQDVRASSTP